MCDRAKKLLKPISELFPKELACPKIFKTENQTMR